MNTSKYRKFVIAAVAAGVTLANAFGVANAEEISKEVVAVFDALAAIFVYVVPND